MVENQNPNKDVLTDDESLILERVHDIRNRLVEKLSTDKDGKFAVPDEASKMIALIALLKDVDSQQVAKAKLRLAHKKNQNDEDMNAWAAQVLLNHRPQVHPERKSTPTLPESVKLSNPVPGEMDTGMIQYDMQTIMGSQDKK